MEMITREICERIVGKNFAGVYQLEAIGGEKKGALGEYYRLRIETSKGERAFFVKTVLRNPNRPQFTDFVTAKERRFYDEVEKLRGEGADFNFMPVCYIREERFLILEEVEGSNRERLDAESVNLVLEQLAEMHAFTWIWENRYGKSLSGQDFLREALFATEASFVGSNYVAGIIHGLNRLLLAENFGEALMKNFDILCKQALQTFNANESRYKKVCCHVDLWANNVLYLKNGSCKLIDFQMIRYQPPAHDLNMLIYLNCAPKTIQNNLESFIWNYHKHLQLYLNKHGIEIAQVFSKSEYYESCAHFWNITKFIRLYYKAFRAATIQRRLSETIKPLDVIMRENNGDFILGVMKSDAQFKHELSEILHDFKMVLRCPAFPPEFCYMILNRFFPDYTLRDYEIVNALECDLLDVGCVEWKVRMDSSPDFVLIKLPGFLTREIVLRVDILNGGQCQEHAFHFDL